MLVLTRKTDEGILIGDKVEIKILGIKGDKVQIGIKAPKSYTILRTELYQEVTDENISAQELDLSKIKGLDILWKE